MSMVLSGMPGVRFPLRLLISLLNGMAHVHRSLRLKLIAVITIYRRNNLSVGKQLSEGELHANKDDALRTSGPCSCSCKCSGAVAVASLEGLKLDIAILESRLNLANPSDEILSELSLIRNKQRDVEATIRKQDEIICKLYEDNTFFKSKLQSFINLIPAASHNNQENNTGGKISFANNVCKSPSIVNNQFHENKDCASGDSLILIDEPQLSDVSIRKMFYICFII